KLRCWGFHWRRCDRSAPLMVFPNFGLGPGFCFGLLALASICVVISGGKTVDRATPSHGCDTPVFFSLGSTGKRPYLTASRCSFFFHFALYPPWPAIEISSHLTPA